MKIDQKMKMIGNSVYSVKYAFLSANKSPNITVELFRVFVRERVATVFGANDNVEKQIRVTHG